uniref:restriction endonuclease subunit S n=1 Tax=Duncaniella muris TaxID=2094150 RepID=UPI003F67F308
NVPPLRFPGFTDKWKRIKVSELLDFYSTNSLSWDMLNYDGGEIKNLHYGLIHSGLPTLVDVSKDSFPFVNEASTPKKYTLCKEGDVAFADASEDTNEVGKVVEFLNTNGENIISGLHTIHGRDKSDMTVTGFKGYAFSSMPFHHQIRRIAQGTKIYSISTKTFDEVYIGVPTKDEQAKIARLLQLLDERIATQNKIIDNLQSLIKGLNDKFHEEVQGELVSFSEIGIAYSGLSGKSGDDFGQGYPFITYLNVYQNNVINEDDFGLVTIAANESQHTISHGDVLFTLSSETPDEVGIGSVYLGESDKFYLNSFCLGVSIPNKDRIYPPYLAHLVSSTKFRKFVYPLAQGSTRFNLQKNDFMKKKFILPTIEKQRRIATTLDAINAQLANEKRLKDLYIAKKEYLLRQIFI